MEDLLQISKLAQNPPSRILSFMQAPPGGAPGEAAGSTVLWESGPCHLEVPRQRPLLTKLNRVPPAKEKSLKGPICFPQGRQWRVAWSWEAIHRDWHTELLEVVVRTKWDNKCAALRTGLGKQKEFSVNDSYYTVWEAGCEQRSQSVYSWAAKRDIKENNFSCFRII